MLQALRSKDFTVVVFHEYVLPASSPNSVVPDCLLRRACVLWCDSHHQRRTPTPCRAVGVCCWTAYPSHTSSMKAPSEGMLQKTQGRVWPWNLAGSGSSACPSSLLCVMGAPALVHLLSTESSIFLAVSRSTFLHATGRRWGQSISWHSMMPPQGWPPWDQLCSLAALECSKEEKPCGWVRKVSDYWQSILIYINNSAILSIVCIVLISDILSIMCKYLGFCYDFNT